MHIWIARDKGGHLWLYKDKPYLDDEIFMPTRLGLCWKIPVDYYPEVTFENSPKKLLVCDL